MIRRIRFTLRMARVCRWIADWNYGAELRLLAMAKSMGWKPDGELESADIKARAHRQRAQKLIDEARAKIAACHHTL